MSVRDGGLSNRPVVVFAGDWGGFIAGIERLSLNSCALVVVGSVLRDAAEALVATSRDPLRGVAGSMDWEETGVVGPAWLETEDWAECPFRDCERRGREILGPPLSETGSSEDWVRSWLRRGSREGCCWTGLLVKVMEADAFGREGLSGRVSLTLIFRWRLNFRESKTVASPRSRPAQKSSLSSSAS